MRSAALISFVVLSLACSGAPAFDCERDHASEGLLIADRCPGSALRLLPSVRIDGRWMGAGRDGTCEAEADAVRCPAGEQGSVVLSIDDAVVRVRFDASREVLVEGLSLEGRASLEGAHAWISNGFQSWSQSGPIALAPPASEEAIVAALAQRGDLEVLRRGNELSWEQTLIGGGRAHLVAGALQASRFRPWIQAYTGDDGEIGLRLASGGAGERVRVDGGASLEGEPFFVRLGDDPRALIEAYGARIESRARTTPLEAQAGWNSWYELWDTVDEEAVRANAALARDILEPRLPPGTPLRIVVDDGWQVRWGEWEANVARFPSGLDGLATDLRADGFAMGVWLAPLLVDEDSVLVTDHPEWWVAGASYLHAKNGRMRVLDVTHPDAAAHLASVIARIVGWGYDLLKIDFLFAGTFEGDRFEDVTPMEAYARALSIMREAAGEDVILLAVGAPAIATLPYADGWRVGGDIALEPTGVAFAWIPNQIRSIAARVPFCLATLCDADPPIMRVLPEDEVQTSAWVVALAGGALFLSDDLRALPAERPGWALDAGRVALSIGGAPSIPEDVLPADAPSTLINALTEHLRGGRSSHVVPQRWRLPDGSRVALNVRDAEAIIDGVAVPPRSVRPLP